MQTHLPAKVLEVINLETLTIQPDSFVKKSLKKQITDVLFSCQINDQVNEQITNQISAFIYVLCEHQSKSDHWMSPAHAKIHHCHLHQVLKKAS